MIDESPTPPHWPVRLTLKGHRVLARRRPKAFPTELPIGPRQQEAPFDWTWEAGSFPSNLELAWLEWLRASEAAWCRIHDLCGAHRRPYLGKSQGLVIRHVSLGQASQTDARRKGSKQAAAWRSLRRLVAQAVGSLSAWRKGRVALNSALRATFTIHSTDLPDLGPWDPGWEFSSKGALTQDLVSALTSASWAGTAKRVMMFITRHTQQAVNAAASASARAWRTWAKEACQGFAGAGHAFSKLGSDDGPGLAGPKLLVQQMGDLTAAVVGRATGGSQAAERPGGLGCTFATTLTRRGRRCVQDIQECCWVGPRLHQP